MSNILILNGSPRKNGNTERLAEAFRKGAVSAGHEVTLFSVRNTKVNGCLGCDYCMQHEGQCVQKDGMQEIYDALYRADTVVFASPSYYFGWTSQLKAIVDRFYATGMKPLPITSAAMLVALGGSPEADAAAAVANYQAVRGYLQWQDRGMVFADGVMDKNDSIGHPALFKAEELGRSI